MEVIVAILLVWGAYAAWKTFTTSTTTAPADDPQPAPEPERGPEPPSGADDPATDEVPTFRVVSLGTSGAGKTVMLASMFHELAFRSRARPYVLDSDAAQRATLGKLYTELIDTAGPWPRGTRAGEETEYRFPCVARDDGRDHVLFEISYLDYAGELFTSSKSKKSVEKLRRHVSEAHALFGMLDGRRLAQYLRGESEGITYMNGEILAMFGWLTRARCPIHLLVTKWDLVNGVGETDSSVESRLELIRDALVDHAPIQSLVLDAQERRQTIRLIPVSSVGEGFARIDGNGDVVKIKGARAGSINLHVPFAAIVPDYLERIRSEMEAADRAAFQGSAIDSLREGVDRAWKKVSSTTTTLIHALLPHPHGIAVATVTDLVARWLGRSPEERLKASNAARSDELDSRQRAEDGLLDSFVKTMWTLENEAPSSVLAGGLF